MGLLATVGISLFIFCSVDALIDKRGYNMKRSVTPVITSGIIVFGFMFVLFLSGAFITSVTEKSTLETEQKRYDSLVYQLEHKTYGSDIYAKTTLYNQIVNWNNSVKIGKEFQYNEWVGAFYPDIYDELKFIELE